ncbi:MAG: DNA primase [Bacteroidia bacterium]|nr:DNA primase [Bacteroidia bacterium]MCZ2247563.1 DNA primase [Bacteroidia bacterium]
MIPKDTIAKIIDAAEIVDVISDFVSLKKKGVNYLGNCPFHNEKTPSFTVSSVKGIYKCFGCGKSGTSVNFIMEHEGLTYPEALRFLARKYNIKVEEVEQTADEIKEQNAKESMMLLTAYAQQQFTHNLWHSEEGKNIGLSYFKERGFSKQTIEKFQLGYALENRKAFTDKAVTDGYLIEFLTATGLTIESEDGRHFDRFAGRVMFPILNISGRPIAFGGRILGNNKKLAKYLNSPESQIYHKSNILYGLFQAKKSIVEKNNCYLVEGYTDVISLSQAGIENVVASSGTSLTTEQIRQIRRFSPNVTVMYDGDNAGIKASFRGIDLILNEGLNVKVILFPDGEDPDSFAQKHTQEDLILFLEKNAVDFITFKTNLLLNETQNDPYAKAQLINEIVESISVIPDSIARSLYTKECARIMQVEEQLLLNTLNKLLRQKRIKEIKEDIIHVEDTEAHTGFELPAPPPEKVSGTPELELAMVESEIIRLLLLYGAEKIKFDYIDENEIPQVSEIHLASYIFTNLLENEITFDDLTYNAVFTEYMNEVNQGNFLKIEYFLAHENVEIRDVAAMALVDMNQLSPNWESKYHLIVKNKDADLKQVIINTIDRLKQKHLLRMLHQVQEEIKNCKEEEKMQDLLVEYKTLLDMKELLFGETGTTISH